MDAVWAGVGIMSLFAQAPRANLAHEQRRHKAGSQCRQGGAGKAQAWYGTAELGRSQARLGLAWCGRQGLVRPGWARCGSARLCKGGRWIIPPSSLHAQRRA
jgi:hypothetical protein